jgi:hypothetical protein
MQTDDAVGRQMQVHDLDVLILKGPLAHLPLAPPGVGDKLFFHLVKIQ